jgi:hypothetical protein
MLGFECVQGYYLDGDDLLYIWVNFTCFCVDSLIDSREIATADQICVVIGIVLDLLPSLLTLSIQ